MALEWRLDRGVRRIIRPSGSCLTLECPNCQGVDMRVFIEPLPANDGGIVREILCGNPKCGKVCKIEGGLIGGRHRRDGSVPSRFAKP